MSTLFVELISILVNASMYFYLQIHDTIVKWSSETLGRLHSINLQR